MRTETKMENQCTQQFVRSHARKASNEGLKYSTDSILSLMNNFVKAVGSMEETVLVPSRLMDVSVGSTRDADLSPSARLLHKSAPKWATKSQSDLFNFFTTIKQVHNTLMWGGKSKLENTSNNNISKRARGFYSDQVSTSVPSVSVSGLDSPRSSVCPSTPSSSPPSTADATHHHHHPHHQLLLDGGSRVIARQPSSASLASGFEDCGASSACDDDYDAAEASSTDSSSDSGLDQEHGHGSGRTDALREISDRFADHLSGLLDCLEEFTAVAEVVSQRYQEEVGNC